MALHLPMLVRVLMRERECSGLTPTHVGDSVNGRKEGIVALHLPMLVRVLMGERRV